MQRAFATKLALGTAQFGMNYGIANRNGRPPFVEIERILDAASAAGVTMLDTAIAYGDSEELLGAVGVEGWDVVTKVPAGVNYRTTTLKELVEASLERLRLPRLYGLLLHDQEALLGPDRDYFLAELSALKEEGLAGKVGISIYGPERLGDLLDAGPLDLIQGPLNLFDQRMLESGWLEQLQLRNVEFHARSVFLQGLLLTPLKMVPRAFAPFLQELKYLWQWRSESRVTALSSCLGFVLGNSQVDKTVVGVDSVGQMNEILDSLQEIGAVDVSSLSSDKLALIDPRRWGVG